VARNDRSASDRGGDREDLPPCAAASLPPGNAGGSPPWVRPGRTGDEGSSLGARDESFHARYPTLHAWLAMTEWGGKERASGSVQIFCGDGVFKCRVSDKQEGYVAFLSSKTVEGLWEALEKGLKGGSLDWRVDKYAKRR